MGLEKAEKETPYGYYLPEGIANNMKIYGCKPHGTKPPKGWYSSRPGVAEREGFARKEQKWAPAEFEKKSKGPSAGPAPAATPALTGEPPLPIGLMFPGQGSQYVKMLTGVKDLPAVKEML